MGTRVSRPSIRPALSKKSCSPKGRGHLAAGTEEALLSSLSAAVTQGPTRAAAGDSRSANPTADLGDGRAVGVRVHGPLAGFSGGTQLQSRRWQTGSSWCPLRGASGLSHGWEEPPRQRPPRWTGPSPEAQAREGGRWGWGSYTTVRRERSCSFLRGPPGAGGTAASAGVRRDRAPGSCRGSGAVCWVGPVLV